jgi:hypothetical protein
VVAARDNGSSHFDLVRTMRQLRTFILKAVMYKYTAELSVRLGHKPGLDRGHRPVVGSLLSSSRDDLAARPRPLLRIGDSLRHEHKLARVENLLQVTPSGFWTRVPGRKRAIRHSLN